MLTSSMMTKAMSKRAKATILYATETGKSQMFAEQLKGVFNFAFNAKVSPLVSVFRLVSELKIVV